MHLLALFFLLIALWATSSLQDAAIQCPNVRLASPFDLKQFLGTWYEIAKFHKRDPDLGSSGLTIRPRLSSCVRLTFSQMENGKLRVERTGLDNKNNTITQVGMAEQGAAEHARFFFTYPDSSEEELGVVEVDYKEHALLYGCYLTRTGHVKQDAWIIGREPQLADMTVGILQGSLHSRRVNVSAFRPVSQQEFCKQAVPDNGTLLISEVVE